MAWWWLVAPVLAQGQVVVNERCACAVPLPEGWVMFPRESNADLENFDLVIGAADDSVALGVQTIERTVHTPGTSGTQLLYQIAEAMLEDAEDPDFGEIERLTVGGHRASRAALATWVEGFDMVFEVTVIEEPTRYVSWVAWTSVEDADVALPEARQVVALTTPTTLRKPGVVEWEGVRVVPVDGRTLAQARAQEPPLVEPKGWWTPTHTPLPPAGTSVVYYPSPAGELVAYLSSDPGDGVRRPAVLFAHEGYGSIGLDDLDVVAPLVDAGLVVMVPAWRGENDNPGAFEGFGGELDDLAAARAWLARQPHVDPDRIHLVGHSAGGTLALLAAVGTPGFRSVLSLGGSADVSASIARFPEEWAGMPFPVTDSARSRTRSAVYFVDQLKVPTLYLEGELLLDHIDAESMEATARVHGVPFTAYDVGGASHTTVVKPVLKRMGPLYAEDVVGPFRFPVDSAWLDALEDEVRQDALAQILPELREVVDFWIAAGVYTEGQIRDALRDEIALWEYSGEHLMLEMQGYVGGAFDAREELEVSWTGPTSSERVDAALASLAERGMHVYSDYGAHSDETIDLIWPTFLADEDAWGFAFTTREDVLYAAATGELMVSYGAGTGSRQHAKIVGDELATALRMQGLEVEWSGSVDDKVTVRLEWAHRMYSDPFVSDVGELETGRLRWWQRLRRR